MSVTQIPGLLSFICVAKVDKQSTLNYVFSSEGPNSGVFYNGSFSSTTGFGGYDWTNFRQIGTEDLNQHILAGYISGGDLWLSLDGAAFVNAGTFTGLELDALFGRAARSNLRLEGQLQEVIVWQSDESANMAGIIANVNNYHGVF